MQDREYSKLVQDLCRVDEAFYDRVRAAEPRYEPVEKLVIPPFSGRAFTVKRGQVFRVVQTEGPQAAVVAFWNAGNHKEYYNAMRGRIYEGLFIKPLTRIWSDVPYFRPMATCIEDTVVTRPPTRGFHHHRFWTHCSPEVMEMRSGRPGLNGCHLNLLRAVEPFRLKDERVRYNINLFQKARLDPDDGKFYGARSDSKTGDYVAFYAEIDLLVAVSVCPHGDNTRDWSVPEDDAVLSIGVEVHETGIAPKEFPRSADWRPGWKGRWTEDLARRTR